MIEGAAPPRARGHGAAGAAVAALALCAALVAGWSGAGCGVDADVSRTLGARCDRSAECDDRCLPPGEDFPGGFCSVSCESSGDCPSGASCTATEAGVCLFDCAGDADCAFLGAGWRCIEDALRADPAREVRVCRGD